MRNVLFVTSIWFLQATNLYAQSGPADAGSPPSFGETLVSMLPMFIMVFLIFYFLVVRPQNQKMKQHQDLLSSLKKGDQVITSSGVFGRIAGVESDHILLEIAQNVRIKIAPDHVTGLQGGGAKSDKKAA